MRTVNEAVGWNILFAKYWLVEAVNSIGAVSPVARATANSMPVKRPFFPVLITILSTVFHLGTPRAIEASLNVIGTSLRDSLVVLAIMGSITKLRARPPAKAENCFVVRTSITKTNSPSTIEGNPVSTSFIKPEIVASLELDHSEKKMPAPIPIGTEIREAIPTMVKVPIIALAIPPPGTSTGVGKWVRKPVLMAGAPRTKTSPNMSIRGITARTTATNTNTVINLLTIFRQSEILVGRLDFIIATPSQNLTRVPRVTLQSRSRARTLINKATKNRINPNSIIED
jgi:hypothetical protein